MLGSSPFASKPDRTPYSKTQYAPFGEPYKEWGTQDRSFTGLDQDTAPGLYDFPERQLHAAAGRWLAPDSLGFQSAKLEFPQSWNRYAYVINNPLLNTDPTGSECEELSDVSDDGCGDDDNTTQSGGAGEDWSIDFSMYGGDPSVGFTYPVTTWDCGSCDSQNQDESVWPGGQPARQGYGQGYVAITISVGIGSLSLIRDEYGDAFIAPGANLGKGLPLGFSVVRGLVNGKPNASRQTLCDTLSGLSFGAGIGVLFGAGETYTPSNGDWTTQFGVFTPQAGAGASYGFIVGGCKGDE